eukprot:PhF_6_TR40190/c0_g1_i1/m.59629
MSSTSTTHEKKLKMRRMNSSAPKCFAFTFLECFCTCNEMVNRLLDSTYFKRITSVFSNWYSIDCKLTSYNKRRRSDVVSRVACGLKSCLCFLVKTLCSMKSKNEPKKDFDQCTAHMLASWRRNLLITLGNKICRATTQSKRA